MRIYTCLSLLVLLASSAPAIAVPLTPGNILASNGNKITEYTFAGEVVQSILVPAATGGGQDVRDLVVDQYGHAHMMTVPGFQPYLSTYNFNTETWTHTTITGWGQAAVGYYGGIGANDRYIFAADQTVGGGPNNGILRFPIDNLSGVQRFLDGNGGGWHRTIIGLDGYLYALNRDGALHKYNPDSMQLLNSVNVSRGSSVSAVAVAANGDIYAGDGSIHIFTPDGTYVESHDLGGAYDFALRKDGTLVIGTGIRKITVTSIHDFSNFYVIDTTAQLRTGTFDTTNHVTYTSGEFVPEPSTLMLAGLGGLGLVGFVLRRKR